MHQPSGALAGKSLLLLPRTTAAGPSCRLRMIQYLPWLEAAGARVALSPFFDDAYLETYFRTGRRPLRSVASAYLRRLRAVPKAGKADLVWVEKEVFPFMPGAMEGRLARTGTPYVVDLDDAIFHNYDASRSGLVRRLLSSKLDPLFRHAAGVTAGNAYLADYAAAHGARCVLPTPTVVDPTRYPAHGTAPGGGGLRVGWIGTPANARYLEPVIAAIRAIADRCPATLVTIGAPPMPGIGIPHERHDWSEESEGPLLAGIHVGVMPLADAPWERGKCGYKLIQYMAAGKAVVASPVGVNAEMASPDVGYLATGVDQWAEALLALGAAPDRRAEMGAAARRKVEERYSIHVMAPKVVAFFSDILGGRTP